MLCKNLMSSIFEKLHHRKITLKKIIRLILRSYQNKTYNDSFKRNLRFLTFLFTPRLSGFEILKDAIILNDGVILY